MGGEGLPSNLRFSSPSPEWAPKRKRGQEREGQGEDTETGQETAEGPGGLWGQWPPPCSPMPTRLSLSAWPLTPDTAPTPKEQAHPSRACWPAWMQAPPTPTPLPSAPLPRWGTPVTKPKEPREPLPRQATGYSRRGQGGLRREGASARCPPPEQSVMYTFHKLCALHNWVQETPPPPG